jgi:lysophospholipase L1-like esterase
MTGPLGQWRVPEKWLLARRENAMARRIRIGTWASLLWVGSVVPGGVPCAGASEAFAIRDGDRIVFYGDSITDQRLYTTFVESYIVTRFPTLKVSFVHSGWGGDRVSGGGGGPVGRRLARDVIAYKPTVVTVMLGMNDAGYQPFKQQIFDVYAKGYRRLVDELKSALPGVRLTLIQPSPFDDVTRKPAFEGGYNGVLVRYGEFVKDLAGKEGAQVADLNTSVVTALTKAQELDRAHAQDLIRDRVHPGPAGQLLMATALLKAWHAPTVVSTVEIDAASAKAVKQENASIEELRTDQTISWRQRDGALPMPINFKDKVIGLALKASDVEQALNQQVLKVSGLSAGAYRLKIDGDEIAELPKDQLASGVNLAVYETPMQRQARVVHTLTTKHNDVHFTRWRVLQVPYEKQGYANLPKALDGLDALEGDIVAEQRAKAQPVPHRFELVPLS